MSNSHSLRRRLLVFKCAVLPVVRPARECARARPQALPTDKQHPPTTHICHSPRSREQIVTRLAPTFLRFGSFEIFKPRDPRTGRDGPSAGNDALRLQMLEYAVRRFFPDAAAAGPEGSKARYLAL